MVRVIPDTGLVVAAAGCGRRFGDRRNKLLADLDGLPVFCHCLRNLLPILPPENVVLVVRAEFEPAFRREMTRFDLPPAVRIVLGGDTRPQSVARGLAALPEAVEIAAIQDAARPYTPLELLVRCIESARRRGSGVAARRVTDTIKVADPRGRVLDTPDRTMLWAAETPQVFRRELIETAYRRLATEAVGVTDDARAVELMGESVYLVEHCAPNPKITFPHDLPCRR
ncbi:MAG: 2-C-methyl-D-erythritol 4-phosphate cytidylyltransferase [Kiritimatiellaeota bacterium]|nr:2-C-methyl-D-erythritol 4-phosphate cytidylyltransferase [Kiritimatiellota bacterium]